MRLHLLNKLPVPEIEDDEQASESDVELARKTTTLAFGPRTAAWLINQHRPQFHRNGEVDFVVPAAPNKIVAEKLRWFFIAMDCLSKYRDGWAVDVRVHRDKRTFRVRWLNWNPSAYHQRSEKK